MGYYYSIIGIINSEKELQLFLIRNKFGNCNYEFIFNIGINNADSKNINCQLMKSHSNDEVLTCFHQISNEIIASSFNIILKINKNEIEPFSTLQNQK